METRPQNLHLVDSVDTTGEKELNQRVLQCMLHYGLTRHGTRILSFTQSTEQPVKRKLMQLKKMQVSCNIFLLLLI